MPIERVGVVGAGTMGNGIAHVLRAADIGWRCATWNSDFSIAAWKPLPRTSIANSRKAKLRRGQSRGAQTDRPILKRGDLSACDFVIEAATEKFEIKAEIFGDLDQTCRPEVILATNTSSIFDHPAGCCHPASGEKLSECISSTRCR